MAIRAVLCVVAVLAMAGHASEECAEQPPGDDVVIKAHRFSDGRSYAYLKPRRAANPRHLHRLGRVHRDRLQHPATSMGAPNGWRGMDAWVPDPRWPRSHSPRLIQYLWEAEDPDAWIQPGRSLSGFSIQLPTPHESVLAYLRVSKVYQSLEDLPTDPPFEERLVPQPDLTDVPFKVLRYGGCDVSGAVELDGGPKPATAGNS